MKITAQRVFGGIDENVGLQSNLKTAELITNFRVNNDGSLEKRNGIVQVGFTYGHIDAIWGGSINHVDTIVVAAEGFLYYTNAHIFPFPPVLIGEIGEGECTMFGFGGLLYVKTESKYFKYDGANLTEVEGYIPCVAISCLPSGEGELLDQINLICDKRRQLFSSDGKTILYRLAEKNIDDVISIKVDGIDYAARYSINKADGTISFEQAPTAGLNNVEIVYTKANADSDKKRFFGCKKVMLFGGNSDGRAFLWGNDEYPNYRFHSELADGVPSVEYFPINAFTVIGDKKINCIKQQYDKQLIFTENEAFYSYCELKDDGLGNLVSSFPVYSLNGNKGCIIETEGCIIDNRPVTLCDDGLNMWESTAVENEKNAVCFSTAISKSIKNVIRNSEKKFMLDFQANREFYLICNDLAYVYNYSNGVWYMYDGFMGECYAVIGRTLYFSKGNYLYAFSYDQKTDNDRDCNWTGNYSTGENATGTGDVIGFEVDYYVRGPITVQFVTQTLDNRSKIRLFEYDEGDDRIMRISFRTALKRSIPFRVSINTFGTGEFTLYRITTKTRTKERSRRNGLL